MNKTHYFAFASGITAAVLWIGAPYESGTELIYLVVGFFVVGWIVDRIVEVQWSWLWRSVHKLLCPLGMHEYKNYLDGLFFIWCHRQRHLTNAEITKLNEDKARLYEKELESVTRKFRVIAESQRSESQDKDNQDS